MAKIYEHYSGSDWLQAARHTNMYFRKYLPSEVGIKVGNNIHILGRGPFKKLSKLDKFDLKKAPASPSGKIDNVQVTEVAPFPLQEKGLGSNGNYFSENLLVRVSPAYDDINVEAVSKMSPQTQYEFLRLYFNDKQANSQNSKARFLYANACLDLYKKDNDKRLLDKSAKFFRRALIDDCFRDRAYEGLGLAKMAQNDLAQALICFRKALEINPSLLLSKEQLKKVNERLILLGLQNIEVSKRPINRTLKENPELRFSVPILEMKAKKAIRDVRLTDAERTLAKCAGLEPDNIGILLLLGKVRLVLKDLVGAEKCFSKILEYIQDGRTAAEAMLGIAKTIIASGKRLERAGRILDDLLRIKEGGFYGLMLDAELSLSEGSVKDARAALSNLLAKPMDKKEKSMLFELYSRIELAEGYKLEAKEKLERAIEIDPDNIFARKGQSFS